MFRGEGGGYVFILDPPRGRNLKRPPCSKPSQPLERYFEQFTYGVVKYSSLHQERVRKFCRKFAEFSRNLRKICWYFFGGGVQNLACTDLFEDMGTICLQERSFCEPLSSCQAQDPESLHGGSHMARGPTLSSEVVLNLKRLYSYFEVVWNNQKMPFETRVKCPFSGLFFLLKIAFKDCQGRVLCLSCPQLPTIVVILRRTLSVLCFFWKSLSFSLRGFPCFLSVFPFFPGILGAR